ncbi:glutaminase domain-containing protein [uncultured Martelella sp.]|uniref:glutaminase domain-containing protein n=1 Tax=uncultured Martelella sp. TaxID=392331 RepID=UPI0029C89ABB|nr:DUF4965 domain-containing protein [uncultured Martelella sp.]
MTERNAGPNTTSRQETAGAIPRRSENTKAPAYPLIVHDPFFSIWSTTDRLTDAWPTHWSGRTLPLCGLALIDGVCFRWMGTDTLLSEPLPAMKQTRRRVTPTRTLYSFEASGVRLDVAFITPALPDDLDVLSRPLSYISLDASSTDGIAHDIKLYVDIAAALCIDETEGNVIWGRHKDHEVTSLWTGALDQRILTRGGDNVLTDWGYLHLSAVPGSDASLCIGEGRSLRRAFARDGVIPERDGFAEGIDLVMPAKAAGGEIIGENPVNNYRPPFVSLAASTDLGHRKEKRSWTLALAFDQTFAVEYFGRKLPPWWRRRHNSAISMIATAWAEFAEIDARCTALDQSVMKELRQCGGTILEDLGALSWRQCLGGHALVSDIDGTPLHFSKENSSNGCMGTVDLTYPAAPFFLLYAPQLLAAQLRFIFDYASSPRWTFPFAPHDVGRYPLANGQVYGGCEESEVNQMPYEECGNMLILSAALIRAGGDTSLRAGDWQLLKQWADYLLEAGFDPANQLSTDDFDGHMPHNTNLSIKAIIALGGAAILAEHFGDPVEASRYESAARAATADWLAVKHSDEHYPMRFDMPDSWSLKYNLVWDCILKLDLFPMSLATTETQKYRDMSGRYGTPLYSAAKHTKLDWLVWAACLTGKRDDQDALLAPIGRWLAETTTQIPLNDWYDTDTGEPAKKRGFRGRPVVGGVFMPLLSDRAHEKTARG